MSIPAQLSSSSPLMISWIDDTMESVHPTTPNTTIAQLEYFLNGVTVSLNSSLKSKGGNIKAITPAPNAPAMSKKTVKSGMTRATPVIHTITIERIAIFLSLVRSPCLKNGCYSAISKAAKICTG